MLKKLERSISLTGVIIISISGMLGSGIFVLPSIVYPVTGPSLWLAYFIAALGVLPTVFSKSELSTAMPTSGGTYIYIERTLGPFMGTIAGLGLWISLLLKCSFALIGFGAYLSVFTTIDITHTSLALLLLITTLNILGVGKVTSTLFIVVIISTVSLTGIFVLSLPSLNFPPSVPFMSGGYNGLFSTAATVFISYAGVTKIAAIAEEIKDPGNNLPKGMFYSLLVTTLVYCMATIALTGVLDAGQLTNNLRPFYTLGQVVGGPIIAVVLALVAILTMTSMANAGLLAASRFPYAMGRDKLLPSFLGRVSKIFVTPVTSILLSAFVIAFCIITGNVEGIAKVASAFMIIMFLMVHVSVIILREAQVQWYRPHYKSPLYPFMQIFGIFCCSLLLWNMGIIVLKAFVAIVIPASLLFLLYSKNKVTRKGVVGIRGLRKDLIHPQDNMEHCHSMGSYIEDFKVSTKSDVVVVLFGRECAAEMLIEMSIALAGLGHLEVAHITEIPEQTHLDDSFEEPASFRSLKRRIMTMASEKQWPIAFDPVITHDIVKTIHEIGLRSHCRWLAVEWGGRNKGALTFHRPVGWPAKKHLKCNLAVFHDTGVRYIREIMVLVNGTDDDSLVANAASRLASVYDAGLAFIRYTKPRQSPEYKKEEESRLKALIQDCNRPTTFHILESTNELSSISKKTIDYDLLVFGGKPYRFIDNFLPSRDDRIMENAACSALCVQECEG